MPVLAAAAVALLPGCGRSDTTVDTAKCKADLNRLLVAKISRTERQRQLLALGKTCHLEGDYSDSPSGP